LLVTAWAVCFLPVLLQMQSGFAHFQRFATNDPAMNVPYSPSARIFAAICRLTVLIDFGILIVWIPAC